MPNATAETIQILARQAARWTTAARQDANPFIANLHANYGAAYVFALRQVASDAQIRQVLGIDGADLERQIVAVQDQVAARIGRACPGIVPRGPLAKIAKEGLGALPFVACTANNRCVEDVTPDAALNRLFGGNRA